MSGARASRVAREFVIASVLDAKPDRRRGEEAFSLENGESLREHRVAHRVRHDDDGHRLADVRIRLPDARDADPALAESRGDPPEDAGNVENGQADVMPEENVAHRDEADGRAVDAGERTIALRRADDVGDDARCGRE